MMLLIHLNRLNRGSWLDVSSTTASTPGAQDLAVQMVTVLRADAFRAVGPGTPTAHVSQHKVRSSSAG